MHVNVRETLQKQQGCLQKQREAVKQRLEKLAVRQSEITRKSLVIRKSIIQKYQEIQAILDEDLRTTLSHLEMEERAAVSTLDGLMERNCSLIQELDQNLAQLTVALNQTDTEPHPESFTSSTEQQNIEAMDRVVDLLNETEPISVSLDEEKADQILSITSNMLEQICSQTPTIKKLIKSYSSKVCLDPDTAHPKLMISPRGDSAAYTDIWQKLPDLPGRFDTTLNVISLQGYSCGRHYWEIDVTGKTYWEIGVTYLSIPRKGTTEDCWLGRGEESWCVEYFDGEYTAWHGGVPHHLPFTKHFCRIGVLCNFPAGLVTFFEAADMTPLYSFCVGRFSDCLHLALCPGHEHNGSNSEPLVICNPQSPTSDPRSQSPRESF
ncbi:probable E3 ubiquitin-protein ligase TRIML1 [Antennarius striatus]|uniref:probable E3 ubiquitin-protein ligase TRIML1 n=1 Tax=Antennarius striatus TaxID=241820 RepID=UPI0035AF2FFA